MGVVGMSDKTKQKIKAIGVRALYTFFETSLALVTVGQGVSDVDWVNLISVSLVSTFISICKSVVVGLPEVSDAD